MFHPRPDEASFVSCSFIVRYDRLEDEPVGVIEIGSEQPVEIAPEFVEPTGHVAEILESLGSVQGRESVRDPLRPDLPERP